MSELILIRHGQACAFTDNPDRLSSLGWQQARALGECWAEREFRFDATFHGTLRRQRETFEAVAEEHGKKGVDFPNATAMPGFNEYEAQDLITAIAPRLAGADRTFARLWDAWKSRSAGSDRNRRFQLMFEALVSRWVDGRLDEPDLEPWETFQRRVDGALQEIRELHSHGARLAVFTSGGVIGVAVQSCLKAPHRAALEVNWRVRNSSVTTFLYSGTRVSLDGFNELPHLAGRPELVTFR